MIYCLTGKIIKKTLDSVVISCGGVGYFVQIPATTGEALPPAGQEGTVYTIMNVTENDVSLYGFAAEEQRDCFKMLTGVTGVGPKAALSILSIMTPEKIALAASSGDHKAFTKAAGVGPKLAQRITLELKDKVGKGLATVFSVLIILALGFMGNMVQSNSIGDAFHNAFGLNRLAVGVVVAAIAAFIFLGGVQRIAAVTEKVVPIMAAFYILGCIVILVINAKALPGALAQVFVLAFEPQAMAGGIAGVTVQQSMRFGVARGLFSNEAGLGSTPHAHALAKVERPQDQGAVAILGVFVDTFVVLTLTGLVLITSGLIPQGMTGTSLTQAAFSQAFGGFGPIFIAVCMFFFAFSTIIGWYFFGQSNFKALFGEKLLPVYSIIVVAFILVGSTLKVDLVWALADLFNGLMAVPNLLALLALAGVVVAIDRK